MVLSGKMTTFVLSNEKIQSPYQRAKIHNFCVSEKKNVDIEIAANDTEVVAFCDHLLSIKYSPTLPYAFTEQGVAMRHFIASNAQVFQRLEVIEHHQL